jgi:hypothetical protein
MRSSSVMICFTDGPSCAALARWMASRERSSAGTSRPAPSNTRSFRRSSWIFRSACSPRPTPPSRPASALVTARCAPTRCSQRLAAGEVAPQRPQLGLGHRKLDDRRRVDVGEPLLSAHRARAEPAPKTDARRRPAVPAAVADPPSPPGSPPDPPMPSVAQADPRAAGQALPPDVRDG